LETFVLRCPTEVTQYIDQIILLCLEYLRYDPNYAVDEEEEEEDTGEDVDMVEEEEEDDEGFVHFMKN